MEEKDRLILLEFYKDDCRQCQTMEPVLEKTKACFEEKLQIVPIDADRNLNVAVAYNVRSVPALILLRDGKICWRQGGLISGRDLERTIRQFM